jgi:hypothetical protein
MNLIPSVLPQRNITSQVLAVPRIRHKRTAKPASDLDADVSHGHIKKNKSWRGHSAVTSAADIPQNKSIFKGENSWKDEHFWRAQPA